LRSFAARQSPRLQLRVMLVNFGRLCRICGLLAITRLYSLRGFALLPF
jgi:hypothetical protein